MRMLVAMRLYNLCVFAVTLVILAGCGSSGFSVDTLTPSSLKDLLTEAEWAHIVGADANLNEVSLGTLKRNKRDIHSHISIESNSLPEALGLRLSPSPDLVDPSFLLVRRWANRTDSLPTQPYTTEEEHCLFRSDTAALSLCGRVRGIVTYNNSFYTVSSLPDRFKSEDDQHHIVLRRSASSADVYDDSLEENKYPNSENIREDVRKVHRWTKYRRKPVVEFIDNIDINEDEKSKEIENYSSLVANKTQNAFNPRISSKNKRKARRKRSVIPAIFVETAVFVDRDLHKHMVVNYPKDTERELVRFVLAMINAVQLLYHDPTLGQTVNFVLKRLEILHEDPVNLKRPHDIDRFLSNFCAWQRLENPTGDTDPLHWDHALILTGLDLYVVSKHGKVSSQVVGLAPVAGMCTVTSSCTVNEGRHFESVYVVAHEIGHNLGMRHDGPLAENECDPSSYIMSPTLGSGKITWSPCSKRYLQSFLDTQQSRCLLDHGSSAGKLDHSAEGLLPGERFGADQQCMLKYGKDSRHASQQPLSDVCRDLHCKRERYTWTSHPALEGTKCGEHKWCRGGRCIGRGGREVGAAPLPVPVPGGWGTWSPWVECASGCLHSDTGRLSLGSSGITVSSRRCDQPRPENGGDYCDGHAKKFRTCVATQCLNVPRMTVSEFSDQICLRAREVDADLIGTGFQRYNTDPADACSVWCHTRGGGLKSRGWTFPDGTTCLTKLGKKPMHCISGLCVEFKCTNNEDLEFTSNLGQCIRDVEQAAASPVASALTSNPVQGPWRRSSGPQWLPASGCHYHCVSPGSGIRIVKSRGNEPKNSIQLCKPDEVGCGHLKTPHEHATYVCTKYKERVRRLSGVGMQISPAVEDPDRPCRIACQDEAVSHRFYLVNGQEGWFPFGTSCSKHKQAYCISGKCLEFGSDNTPLSESEFTLPLLPRNNKSSANTHHNNKTSSARPRTRYARSINTSDRPTRIKVNLEQSHLDDIISKLNLSGMNHHQIDSVASPDKADIFVLDFNNPVYVTPEDSVMARVGRHFTYFDYDY